MKHFFKENAFLRSVGENKTTMTQVLCIFCMPLSVLETYDALPLWGQNLLLGLFLGFLFEISWSH